MRPGRFRHRFELQSLTGGSTAADTRGGSQLEFAKVRDVYASITTLSGDELVHARQIDATATHQIATHFSSDLVEEARLIWTAKTRTFNVLSVLTNHDQSLWQTAICREEL